MQVLVQKGCLKGAGCDSIRSLTAQGKQALNEVLGLKHFLLDFSLIRERALQETLIWQDYMSTPAPGHCRQGRPPAPSALPRPPAGDRPVRPAGDLGRVLQPRDVQRL